MSNEHDDGTVQKTAWTGALLEDLCSALRGKREDDVVRGFANELMNDKQMPIEYLVRKVEEDVGSSEAERLNILIRGRHAVEKSKAERAKSQGGALGFLRRLLD